MTTTTTMSTGLATSNLRSSSRQTRTNATRTSRFPGAALRQNSLVANPPVPPPVVNEPPGFYPAIQHFADAITALPRDFRRHTSLLKEVDAKAWAPEEQLQALLAQCLAEPPLPLSVVNTEAVQNSNVTVHDGETGSVGGSATGAVTDPASERSASAIDPTVLKRRELYLSLRQTLIQMMVTMDEKHHVINNANEELSRHIRRLDSIYPHIASEVSEEARLGSLKHWAYFETNVARKAQSSRREAAASLTIMHETEIAQRSENRREAVLAKRQRLNQAQVDSDFDDARAVGRKGQLTSKTRKIVEAATEALVPNTSSALAGKKRRNEKSIAGAIAMERTASGALGGRSMSREHSQQDTNTKKRKAPVSVTAGARKRLNASAHDSPKLVSSPLASTFTRDGPKRSPVPSAARPATSRGRQTSHQPLENSRGRPSSSNSQKPNGRIVAAGTSELNDVAAMIGKSTAEVKNTMKELTNSRGDRLIEDDTTGNDKGESAVRGGILLERSTSRSRNSKNETNTSEVGSSAKSPRLPAPLQTSGDRIPKGRASKISTPVVGTFAESDASDPVGGGVGTSASANNGGNSKSKRSARPRMKDHHALNDSLSPKSLPAKRSHKKGASSISQTQSSHPQARRLTGDDNATSSATPEYRGNSHGGGGAIVADGDPTATPTSTGEVDEEENDDRVRKPPAAAVPAALDDGEVEGEGDEEEGDDDEEEDDEDEERYCYCNGVSYGEMVACDNKTCKREWFHLECAGLKKAPGDKAKWYCEECKEMLAKKGRFSATATTTTGEYAGGNGNGHAGTTNTNNATTTTGTAVGGTGINGNASTNGNGK